ncbi:MAG: hypothetical protein NT133_11980 [Alphaproteobacteria bacterium]|nr:hypothetical protein [Alphaproteobacteria bacterium]
MTPAPTHPWTAANGIAALMGGMLRALLAALLGVARARPRAVTAPGMTSVVLRAAADAEMATEPYVEWVAVPAPWRAGRLLPGRHARAPEADSSDSGVRFGALVHGPPGGFSMFGGLRTGNA